MIGILVVNANKCYIQLLSFIWCICPVCYWDWNYEKINNEYSSIIHLYFTLRLRMICPNLSTKESALKQLLFPLSLSAIHGSQILCQEIIFYDYCKLTIMFDMSVSQSLSMRKSQGQWDNFHHI